MTFDHKIALLSGTSDHGSPGVQHVKLGADTPGLAGAVAGGTEAFLHLGQTGGREAGEKFIKLMSSSTSSVGLEKYVADIGAIANSTKAKLIAGGASERQAEAWR